MYLQKAFTRALILDYYDLQYYIWIEIDILKYIIGKILSQIISNQYFSNQVTYKGPNSAKSKNDQWHLIVFFSQKKIPLKIRYLTYNQKLLAIIEALKT